MAHQIETLAVAAASHKRILSPPLVTLIRIVSEASVVFLAAYASGVAYHVAVNRSLAYTNPQMDLAATFTVLFVLISFYRDDYRLSLYQKTRKAAQSVVQSFALALVAVIVLAFVTKSSESFSRGSVLLFLPTGLASLIGARLMISKAVRRVTRSGWVSAGRVMVVGFADELDWVLHKGSPQRMGFDVIGVEQLADERGDQQPIPGIRIDAIVDKARFLNPDTIVLALPWSRSDLIEQCVRAFMNLPARVELAPERVLERYSELRLGRLGAMLTLNVLRPPLGHAGRATKRLLDIVLAMTALLLLAPLFAVVALLIRLDSPGPALFRQTRYGFNQKPFLIWKFRTMHTQDNGPVVQQASRNDARITRIGKHLRRLNIDELPQLFNVLIGEMSLVGPRPHAVAHNRFYEGKIDLYARRHNVLPGITGWAQVNGLRGETDDAAMRARVDLDLYYLDNWSLSFDLIIIVMTILSKKSYRNAY
ncbi:MAG TPA: undecaprenyl-phosphate glucose phosphotransferase [Beijerinckiaceae bacterium]|nr:undecaprenyl-phosphate glucose phosphotransferase [Beijerinckiaceae bacterium]